MADFTGGPGFAAFVATFLVVVVAILLFRSLSKHLRKVRTHPPEGEQRADAVAQSTVDATAGAGDAATDTGEDAAEGDAESAAADEAAEDGDAAGETER